jgi:hypothetical protein
MQELEQCMEQLPKEREETYYQKHTTALRSLRLCGEKWFHG